MTKDEVPMSQDGSNFKSLQERVGNELREFFILAGYLYVCFTALAFLKASILRAENIDFARWAFAAIKAAVCAKFMLIGRAFHIGEGYKAYPLIVPTLYKSLAFVAVVFVLTAIEEVVVGLIHGRAVADSLAGLGGGTLAQAIATVIILLLIFVPYFAFRSLGDIIGDRILVRLYFERRR